MANVHVYVFLNAWDPILPFLVSLNKEENLYRIKCALDPVLIRRQEIERFRSLYNNVKIEVQVFLISLFTN